MKNLKEITKASTMSISQLKVLCAAKVLFTKDGKTYRGTICTIYPDKITITSGSHIDFSLKKVNYGTTEIPAEGHVSVPERMKNGYTTDETNAILSKFSRLG